MQYQYGEIFQRLGVDTMSRRGSGWCGLCQDGVLAIMSHQNFFCREGNQFVYRHPGDLRTPTTSTSAIRSIRMIASYFEPNKPVLLPVGVFANDGGWESDGSHIPSKFSFATGDVYQATIREFDAATAYFLCDVQTKFQA